MKLISMAFKGDLLTTAESAQQATFSAYAVAGHDGSTYVVLDNKDPNNSVAASIEFTQPVSSATAIFLTAPSLTSAPGISLGGESIGADGSWTGAESTLLSVNGTIGQLVVPPGSAGAGEDGTVRRLNIGSDSAPRINDGRQFGQKRNVHRRRTR